MLSGTACGLLLLLLLLGVLAVPLAMKAFLCLTLLALGTVPLLVTLLAANETLVVLVPTISLCVHTGGLGTLASAVFVSSTALQLGSRRSYRSSVTLRCPFPPCSIVGLNHRLVPTLLVYYVEQCLGVMHYEIEPHLTFHLAAKLEWLYSGCFRLSQHLAIHSVYCRPPGFTTPVSPLSARCFRRACFCMNTLLSTGTLASIFNTRKIWRQKSTSLVCCTSTPATFRALLKLLIGEIDTGLAIVELVNNHLRHRIYQLSAPRERPVSSIFVCDMHLLLILQVSNKKFAHIVEGNNILTQPRRSVSPDSHLDVRLQQATGSASTSLASPACGMDSTSALRSRPSLSLIHI